MTARFIALEGGEGSGKTTQTRLLASAIDAVATFEPGDTALGAGIRAALLDPATVGLDDRAEALLMAADRAQHVAEVIRPALEQGRHVVCDRYVGSSIAYQGHGRGLDVGWVAALSGWATGGLVPDLTVLVDVPEAIASGRVSRSPDRFEGAGDDFHRRVMEGFRMQAEADPTWAVVDGSGTIDEVAVAVRAVVRDRLQL